jgi:hypothetical protein
MLNDSILDAAAKLVRKCQAAAESKLRQFGAMQDTQRDGFNPVPNVEAVQFHHNREHHWLLSTNIDCRVSVLDSFFGRPNQHIRKQLLDLYSPFRPAKLEIRYETVQRQDGGVQCGDFAIAFLFELAHGISIDQLASIRFDQRKMRTHLIRCFEQGEVLRFPQMPAGSVSAATMIAPKNWEIVRS